MFELRCSRSFLRRSLINKYQNFLIRFGTYSEYDTSGSIRFYSIKKLRHFFFSSSFEQEVNFRARISYRKKMPAVPSQFVASSFQNSMQGVEVPRTRSARLYSYIFSVEDGSSSYLHIIEHSISEY